MSQPAHRVLRIVACCALAGLLASCGGKDSHEKIMEDTFALMERVATIIETVKDEDSARKAAAGLAELAGEFKAVAERNEAIGPPDPDTVASLDKKFEARRAQLESRLNVAKLKAVAEDPDSPLRQSFAEIGDIVDKMR